MGIRKRLYFAAVFSTFALRGAGAAADEQAAPGARTVVVTEGLRMPVRYVDRPLTSPAGVLTPELDFDIAHVAIDGQGDFPTIGSAVLSSGYGITDDLEVRGTLFTLEFNHPFQLAGAGLGATYRFLAGSFEVGGALDFVYQTPSNGNGPTAPGMVILPALPMHAHFGHIARLDITPTLPISTAGIYVPPVGAFIGGETTVGLAVPLKLSLQVVEQLHLGVGTGFSLTFNPGSSSVDGLTVGDTFFIPLGFEVGVAVPGPHGPILEMAPFFDWPSLFVPGIQKGFDAVQGGVWETGVAFKTFFYL